MYLYFETSNNEYRLLADNIQGKIDEVVSDAMDRRISKIINKFLKEHNFKSYYTRVWQEDDNNVRFDVGSHTEFFIVSTEEKEIIEDLRDKYRKIK